jgi:hypothetical protein
MAVLVGKQRVPARLRKDVMTEAGNFICWGRMPKRKSKRVERKDKTIDVFLHS